MSTFYHDSIPNTSGIYRITCTVNGRFYIGSAVNLSLRCKDHFGTLRRNSHKNPKLQNAFNKYGADAFIFEVLELVLPAFLTAREQYWFAHLRPFGKRGYNIAPTAGSNLGMKASPETLAKLTGKSPSPETRKKLSDAARGRVVSDETRAKMRAANRGRSVSEATREKLRMANLGKKQSEETKHKRATSQTGKKRGPETGEKIRTKKLGHPVSEETRAKLRITSTGNTSALGHVCSPEAREKMRIAKIGKKRNTHPISPLQQEHL